jgi:hypothetical protein
MAEDGAKEVGLPLATTRGLTAEEQADLRRRLQAERGRLWLGWASLWIACGFIAVAVLVGHWLRRPAAPPLAGAVGGLSVGAVLAAIVGLLVEVLNGRGALRWLFALLLPLPLVAVEAFRGRVANNMPTAIAEIALFATFAGLALLALRIPDRRAFRRVLQVAEADVARGEVLVFRGQPDRRLAHRLALGSAQTPASGEQTVELLPESRFLVRLNDRPVARPHPIRGRQAALVKMCAELEGLATGQGRWNKRMVRHFLCDIGICAFVCAWWGVGCGDIFHPAGDRSALGGWSPIIFVGLGLVVVIAFLIKYRKDRSEVRGPSILLASVLAIVIGWHARDRVAAELWNLRCSADWKGMTYCRDAAQKLGFFTSKIGNTDILGRICIGSEWPYVMCRYFPRFDPPRCDQVAHECAEIRRTSIRHYVCVDKICEEWQWRCKHGPIDDASPDHRASLRQMFGTP